MKKLAALGMGLLVGASVSVAQADSGKVVDVNAVQAKLRAAKAGWRAKESWVTKLSQDEVKRLLGLNEPVQGSLDFEGISNKGAASIDWRNKDGINWLSPVMNQGNCGSCVAFATVATLEGQTSISQGIPWLHPTFSPGQLFACGGGGCETGWQPSQAARFLQNQGIVDEACSPYTMGSTGEDISCSDKCSNASERTTRITSYSTPSSYGGSADRVKAALAHGPLITTLTVYFDFLTYAGGVYKHTTGDYAGGHAVSLVGYDDSKRAWLIRNSWGQEWGDHGFAWVSYDDTSGIAANTWELEVATGPDQLSVASPSDSEYVSGQYDFKAQRKGLEGKDVTFTFNGPTRTQIAGTCLAETCTASVDTTQLAEGRYEVFAQAGTKRSQVREFFVINHEPEMTLSFRAADGTDLSQPLSGRPEFNIDSHSTPVPVQHLEFRVLDSTGKIAAVKSNDFVLDQMRMGWRTVTVANGQYTLVVHGEIKYLGKTYGVDSNTFHVTVRN